MAAAPLPDVAPQMRGGDNADHNSASSTMDWHGLYQELLFRRGAANPPSSNHMGTIPTNTAPARTPAVRERGCSNIPHIFDALGPKAEEFAMFLQDFEEGEDDEDVLMMLCNGLRESFQTFDGSKTARVKRSECLHTNAFSALLNLLLRILLHRDRELKMAAISAFGALLSASDVTFILRNNVLSHMLELSEDERDAFRQVAALALPATLHSGQQLPIFVDFIAEEVEALQHEQALQQKRVDGPVEEDAASSDADMGELMVAVYTATQKFTLSPNESCRMQGVAAVAAMARRNASVFNALGNNFFPMLCSDSSWRVRAATCLALEDLASLSSDSTTEAEENGGRPDVTTAPSRMPSLLFKFLTDRSPLVKIAALQQLQRTAKLLRSASFVRDSWLLELQQISEDDSADVAYRLPGACLDAVMSILELTEGDHRRTLLELAMDLAQRGGWKLKLTLLKAVGFLRPDELTLISPAILKESFAWDEEGDDCWRIHAATAQQLPVVLLHDLARLGKRKDPSWLRQLQNLFLSSAWAVRQEAGAALRSIVKVSHRLECQGECSLDSLLEHRLPRGLQEVASCKNAFIRQELAFYLHQIWDVVPAARMRVLAAPLLQLLMRDQAPCCSLYLRNWTTQGDFHDELETMLQNLCRDEAVGVREEACGITKNLLERPQAEPVR
ncbi:hypothetical protein Esti_000346 [Eimeria stiedai]